jgi:hypothetical protein
MLSIVTGQTIRNILLRISGSVMASGSLRAAVSTDKLITSMFFCLPQYPTSLLQQLLLLIRDPGEACSRLRAESPLQRLVRASETEL